MCKSFTNNLQFPIDIVNVLWYSTARTREVRVYKKELKEYVAIIASSLKEGESLRTHCVSCNPKSGEKSLSVSKVDGAILYNCFRATCGVRGVVNSRGTWDDLIARTSSDGDDQMEEVYHLSQESRYNDDVTKRINKAFNLSPSRTFSTDIRTGRVVFPNYSPSGEVRGVTLRRYGEGLGGVTGSKVIFKPTPGYSGEERRPSWYSLNRNGVRNTELPLFIVEDPISAMRLADTGAVNAAALMGVYLTPSGFNELADTYEPHKSGNIIICLDNDVPEQAARLRRQLVGLYSSSNVTLRVPYDDPKDLTEDELLLLIGGALG